MPSFQKTKRPSAYCRSLAKSAGKTHLTPHSGPESQPRRGLVSSLIRRTAPTEFSAGLPYAGLSTFPHSRQCALRLDVINPQNGHILCDPKSPPVVGKKFFKKS